VRKCEEMVGFWKIFGDFYKNFKFVKKRYNLVGLSMSNIIFDGCPLGCPLLC